MRLDLPRSSVPEVSTGAQYYPVGGLYDHLWSNPDATRKHAKQCNAQPSGTMLRSTGLDELSVVY